MKSRLWIDGLTKFKPGFRASSWRYACSRHRRVQGGEVTSGYDNGCLSDCSQLKSGITKYIDGRSFVDSVLTKLFS